MKRIAILCLTLAAACGTTDNGSGSKKDAGTTPDGGGQDAGWTVKPLGPYLSAWTVGQAVSVSGVVVTASNNVTPDKSGYFVIQDPAGGPNTGVLVYRKKNTVQDPLPHRGDVVSVAGTMDDFKGQREITAYAVALNWTVLRANTAQPAAPADNWPAASAHAADDLQKDPAHVAADSDIGGRVKFNGSMIITSVTPSELWIPYLDGGFYGGFEVAAVGTTTPTALIQTKYHTDLEAGGCMTSGQDLPLGTTFTTLGGVFLVEPKGWDAATSHDVHTIYPGGCDDLVH
jgi:hypothetical protein